MCHRPPIILSRSRYHSHFIEKGAEALGWGSDKPQCHTGLTTSSGGSGAQALEQEASSRVRVRAACSQAFQSRQQLMQNLRLQARQGGLFPV